jgi:hypothetical protein
MESLLQRQQALQARTAALSQALSSLSEEGVQVDEVKHDLQDLSSAWLHFTGQASLQTAHQLQGRDERLRAGREQLFEEQARQNEQRMRLQQKERTLDTQEQELQRALKWFVAMYQDNLTELELKVKEAKQNRLVKEAELQQTMLSVERDIFEGIEGEEPRTMPRLNLGLAIPSKRTSASVTGRSPGDLSSHRSALSDQASLGGASSKRSAEPRPPSKSPPKVKFHHRFKEAVTPRNEGSSMLSSSSDSMAFDSLMDQLKTQDFNSEDPRWNSDSGTGRTATSEELSNYLQKAIEFKLYDPVRTMQEVVARVEEALRYVDSPEVYSVRLRQRRMDAIVTLIKDKKKARPIQLTSKQPPTPPVSWRKRLQIQGSGEIQADLKVTTPRGCFVFPEDTDKSHTIQSSHAKSSRREQQGRDSFGSFDSDIFAPDDLEQKPEIELEDLLSVKSLENQLGLKTISREMSPRSYKGAEMSRNFGLLSLEFEDDPAVGLPTLKQSSASELDQVDVSWKETGQVNAPHRDTSSESSGVLNSGSTDCASNV